MLGLCVELKGACSACGKPLVLNALSTGFRCAECGAIHEVPASRWRSLLEDGLKEALTFEVGGAREVTAFGDSGQVELTIGRLEPRCRACKAELAVADAVAATGDGGQVPCAGCGAPISVRPIPPGLREAVAPHVTHLIGEDTDQIAAEGEPPPGLAGGEPQALHCPECGAGLTADGGARSFECSYCHSQVVLPDELWQRLHPARQGTLWFLWHDDEAAAQAVYEGLFEWSSIWDLTADADGNWYAIGDVAVAGFMAEDELVVWSMTPDRQTRWVHRGLELQDAYHGRLQVTPGGELLLCHRYKHVLLRLSAEDGTRLGTLGEIEPGGARVPSLDTRDARDFAVDGDGTILLYAHKRLLRFGPDGRAVPTWPTKGGLSGLFSRDLPRPLYRGAPDPDEPPHTDSPCREVTEISTPDVASLRNRPKALGRSSRLTVGFDGCLYVVGGDSGVGRDGDRINWALKYGRDGRQRYRARLDAHNFDSHHASLCADADGFLYLTVWATPQCRALVRVSPDGRETRALWTDRNPHDRLSDQELVGVQPDGMLWIAGRDQRLWVLDRDGNEQFVSDAGRAFDEEFAREHRPAKRGDEW